MTKQFPPAIDNSMRKELVKCETAAMYKYEMGLRTIDEQRVDLHAGKAFATGMEAMRRAYYELGFDQHDSLQVGIKALYAAYGSFIPPVKSNKTADRMAGALTFYANQCQLDDEKLIPIRFPDGTFGIETSFSFDLPIQHPDTGKNLVYCGRFDMLALDGNDDAWVVDEKTTSQMGDKWSNQWLLDSQMTGYCAGARELLKHHGLVNEIKGAIINGLAIRLRDYEHVRLNAYRHDWEIDRWYKQMLADVHRWRDAYVSDCHNQALDHACAQYNNPCEYSPLCKSRNPERLIDGSYIVKFWNPVTREEG